MGVLVRPFIMSQAYFPLRKNIVYFPFVNENKIFRIGSELTVICI